jgi:hypothetical protein
MWRAWGPVPWGPRLPREARAPNRHSAFCRHPGAALLCAAHRQEGSGPWARLRTVHWQHVLIGHKHHKELPATGPHVRRLRR